MLRASLEEAREAAEPPAMSAPRPAPQGMKMGWGQQCRGRESLQLGAGGAERTPGVTRLGQAAPGQGASALVDFSFSSERNGDWSRAGTRAAWPVLRARPWLGGEWAEGGSGWGEGDIQAGGDGAQTRVAAASDFWAADIQCHIVDAGQPWGGHTIPTADGGCMHGVCIWTARPCIETDACGGATLAGLCFTQSDT